MRGVTPVLSRAVHSGMRTSSSAASRAKPAERPLNSEEVYAREDRYGAHNYHPLPVALERGEGRRSRTELWECFSSTVKLIVHVSFDTSLCLAILRGFFFQNCEFMYVSQL